MTQCGQNAESNKALKTTECQPFIWMFKYVFDFTTVCYAFVDK